MKADFRTQKPTGLCVMCGKPTRLFIHQNCHKTDKKPKKLKSLTGKTVDYVLRGIPKEAL